RPGPPGRPCDDGRAPDRRGWPRRPPPPAEVLTAGNIAEVYDIRVEVSADPRTGRLRIDPVGRHPS
ncbi:hypothetical protein ACFWF8_02800, partial [Streptomyces diastaticus]